MTELLTIDEVCAILKMSKPTVRKLPIPYSKMGGSRRYHPDDVERYLDANSSLADRMQRILDRFSEKPGFIYFIQCREFVKVGYSRQPDVRLMRLRVSSPFDMDLIGTVPGRPKAEGGIHRLLKPLHHKREWFRLTGELRSAIQGVCDD